MPRVVVKISKDQDRSGSASSDAFQALQNAYEIVNRIADESRLADAITEAALKMDPDEAHLHVALRIMSIGGPLILLEQVNEMRRYMGEKWKEWGRMLHPSRCCLSNAKEAYDSLKEAYGMFCCGVPDDPRNSSRSRSPSCPSSPTAEDIHFQRAESGRKILERISEEDMEKERAAAAKN